MSAAPAGNGAPGSAVRGRDLATRDDELSARGGDLVRREDRPAVPGPRPDVSVVIPAYNEAPSLRELVPAIVRVITGTGRSYEIVVVDDGSSDDTFTAIADLARSHRHVRGLALRRNFGKSAALATGFDASRGRFIVTMDADLQDDPEEIPAFLGDLEEGLDLVSGWKRKRHDPISKTIPSWFWNRMTSWATGIPLHDFNCGFKAYRREVCEEITLYGEMHRFVPVLAQREGFRIGEREVRHHARRFGRSKYGPGRFVRGFLDLLEVTFLAGGRRTPLHVFGTWGLGLFGAGMLLNLYMAVVWVMERRLRVRPLLLFGVILVILGVQFISIGLLAALIHAPGRRRTHYPVRARVPDDSRT